jgi:hypothetical protein
MRFDVLENRLEKYVLEYIQENLLGKCSNQEYEKILSDLVRKLQQSVQPEFSEIEKRIINILFIMIFSENEECLVVFSRLIESLKNMQNCLELLAIYADKVNNELTDIIMVKYFPELRDKHYELQKYTGRYIPRRGLDSDEFNKDLAFIIENLKTILDNESSPYFREIEDMNSVIKQIQENIRMMKSLNAEQLLEIIFSSPDELFPDFKSKIRELYTRWSKIHDKLPKFVKLKFSEHESDVDEDEETRFEQEFSQGNQDDWNKFKLYNSGYNDEKTNFKSALKLVRRNIHR